MGTLDKDLLKSTYALLEKKPSTTICVFDRGQYYACYQDDAKFVAEKIFLSSTFIKHSFQETKPPYIYVTLNKNQFQKMIKDLLLLHHYRVNLYQTKNRKEWNLISQASPGNLHDFEHIFTETDNSKNNVVIALKLIVSETGAKHVASACYDDNNRHFVVSEFPDDIHFNSLQALLVQFAPKEFLLPTSAGDADYKLIEPLVRRFGTVTYAKTSDFSSANVIQDLNRLLQFPDGIQPNALALPETKLTGAMGCVSALIGYLKLLSEPAMFHQYTLGKALSGQFMRLDAVVVKSLDLFELSGDPFSKFSNRVTDTLYGLLNRCRTTPGKRLLDQWIKMPLLDVNKINERLDIVEALVNESESCQTLSDVLKRFPDIQRIVKSLMKKRGTLLDLYKLYQAIRLIPNIVSSLQKMSGSGQETVLQYLVEPLRGLQSDLSKLVDLVKTNLDVENMRNFEIFVKSSYNEKLSSLKNEMDKMVDKMQKEASQAADYLDLDLGKTMKLENNPQFGYYFRVTNKYADKVRNKKEIRTIDSNKSGIKFRTSKLTDYNERYCSSKKSYEEEQAAIVKELLRSAVTYADPLQRLCSVMATLDVLLAFAMVSRAYGYVRPVVLEKDAGIMELRGARHPCLASQDNLSFIPNDVSFERDKVECLLITGPNMGGKSTYLRQTGLIVVMAQMGSFVPCSSARLSVVDAIFTRVGASDAQLEGASTFRLEMIETASILQAATRNSLILIDELGRGTSTYDGCALAWSIAEYIATNIRCWCMFATHFHELSALDIDLPTVQNLHVTADICDGLFTLLYQVKSGPCGASYGVHIAQMLNLPKTIIEDAARVLNEFAWPDGQEFDKQEDAMEWEPSSSSSSSLVDRTLRDSSAASFVTEIRRIMKNDRIYSTVQEKASALRNLLTKSC